MHAPIKTAILILLISLAFVSSLNFLLPTIYAQPYWLQGWNFRKSHDIVGASGAGSDYQVMFNLHYGSGSDDGQNVYLNSLCQTDFDDVRFTKLDHSLLDYWLEIKVNSDYAIYWVKIAYDLSENRTIYIYYGNSTASSASNGMATFDGLFDDFEGETLNTTKWTVTGTGNVTTDHAYTGSKSLGLGSGANYVTWNAGGLPAANCSAHIMYYDRVEGLGSSPNEKHLMGTGTTDQNNAIGVYDVLVGSVDMYYLCQRGDNSKIALDVGRTVDWHRLEIHRDWEKITYVADRHTSGDQHYTLEDLNRIWIGFKWATNAIQSNWDNFFIRKFVDPPPSHIEGGGGSGDQEGSLAFAAAIMVDGIHDTTGLEIQVGNTTLVDGQWFNVEGGNYTLNATCYFENPATYNFSMWSSYPLGENAIENTTAPLTNITISASGHATLWLDTEPHIIDTYIRVNGQSPISNLTFTIDGVTYANNQQAVLWGGIYPIDATVIEGYTFTNWQAIGGVSVENTTDSTTNLNVTGDPSSLTLHLSAPAIHFVVRIDGEPPEYSWNAIYMNGAYYRNGDSLLLLNGTYDLSANVAARYGFSNWSTTTATDQYFFGNQTIGGYNTTTPMNQKLGAYGTSFNLDRRASVTKIWLYCWASADVQKGRMGIYSIEGYDIENSVLMGSTQELTGINVTAMWRNFTFTPALTLEAGDYAITTHAGDISAGLRGKYDAETGSHFQGNVPDTYADELENPFGSGGSNISNCYVTVYAEYTYNLLQVGNNTQETTFLQTYAYLISDVTLTLNLYTLPDLTNLYTWIALFLAALFLMIWSPSWFAWKIKKVGVTVESIERLGYATLLFLVGFGLLIMCLYA